MIRNALLPALAIAMLSGCATDYSYRNGSGDYYYGRPQVEYRHVGGYGAYGSYGAYGGYGAYGYGGYGGYGYGLGYNRPVYYYDRFGRLVYGYPYGGYRVPYSGNQWRYQPRPPRGVGGRDDHGHDDGNDGERADRRPPWRNLRGMQPGGAVGGVEVREEDRMGPRPAPFAQQAAPRPRVAAPVARPAPAGPVTGGRAAARADGMRANGASPRDDVE